jgi:hypothetical protein
MSRLSNSIVAEREAFIENIFQADPECTLNAANAKLLSQPVFGLNKKMALKRISLIRAKVVANQQVVIATADAVSAANTNNTAEEPVHLDLLAAIA